MHPDALGGFIIGVPALIVAYLGLWRRQRAVFWFAVALILLGIGYLVATGAAADIARMVLG
jgi:hypothetical protein